MLQVSPTDDKQRPEVSPTFIRRSGKHRNARIEPNQVFEACKNYLDLQKPKNEVMLSSSYMVNHVIGMFRVAQTNEERSEELSDQAGEPDSDPRQRRRQERQRTLFGCQFFHIDDESSPISF